MSYSGSRAPRLIPPFGIVSLRVNLWELANTEAQHRSTK